MNRSYAISMFILTIYIFFGCSSESKTLKVSPNSLDFGQVNIGDSNSLQLTLKNNYDKTINISSITTSGSTDFSVLKGDNIPIELENKAEHVIEIQFKPTSSDAIKGLLTITHDGSEKPKEIKFNGDGIPVPRMNISDITYDFGKVYVSAPKTHDFVVSNVGTADLNVDSISITGANATLYNIISGNAPFTITPSNPHTFTLQFSPSAGGHFPVSLDIVHNAVDHNTPLSIPIDAEGVTSAPGIKFSEASPWDIGLHSTLYNSYSTIDLVLTSDGIDPLTVSNASFVKGNPYSVSEFQDKNGNVVNLPQTMQPGDSLVVKIHFSPIATVTYKDTLKITHNGINETSPYDFEFVGEGRTPITKDFKYTGAIENWTVPAGVTQIRIWVYGAQGARYGGGKGALMSGDFTVSPGETFKILVGQKGKDGDNTRTYLGGGGGGGSFVCKLNNDPMIIAGGGGGYTNYGSSPTMDGRITQDGGDTFNNGGGNNGNGGSSGIQDGPASGGGGLLTDGQDGSSCYGGKSYFNGGAGGAGSTSFDGGDGGFGGGGGGNCRNNFYNRSGGGGGYSGGQGGTWSGQQSGGGGGSINNGSNKNDVAGAKSGDGEVAIMY